MMVLMVATAAMLMIIITVEMMLMVVTAAILMIIITVEMVLKVVTVMMLKVVTVMMLMVVTVMVLKVTVMMVRTTSLRLICMTLIRAMVMMMYMIILCHNGYPGTCDAMPLVGGDLNMPPFQLQFVQPVNERLAVNTQVEHRPQIHVATYSRKAVIKCYPHH
jgi:hypothetical protein